MFRIRKVDKMQPPPRKVSLKPQTLSVRPCRVCVMNIGKQFQGNYAKFLKNLHSEQLAKLQLKNQHECDLLEDIRQFTIKRSTIERSYSEASHPGEQPTRNTHNTFDILFRPFSKYLRHISTRRCPTFRK